MEKINLIKWGVVAALGVVATSCTVATVNLSDLGAYGYDQDQHITSPWRPVPPVSMVEYDETASEGSCKHYGDKGEVCTVMYTRTIEERVRYSAASARGGWPLMVGLEYVCERVGESYTAGYRVSIDGEAITDPETLSLVPLPQRTERPRRYNTYVYYTLGGFTPGDGAVSIVADGVDQGSFSSITGEEGKYIEIASPVDVDLVRYADETVKVRLVRPGPDPESTLRGSVTFEMLGARKRFEAVDRLCMTD